MSAEGYRGLTTDRAAQKAGVSVGSVYEYFKDKDAIVDALLERFAEELRNEVNAAFEAARDASFADGLEAVARAVVKAFRRDANLHRELLARAPFLQGLNPLNRVEGDIAGKMSAFLKKHEDSSSRLTTDKRAIVSVKSGRGLIETTCLNESHILNLSNVEPELHALVEGYLLHASVIRSAG